MVKKVFTVLGMHCPSCVMRLESLEDDFPGIQSVKASYLKERMEVVYDETRISEVEILTAVKEKGYEVYFES